MRKTFLIILFFAFLSHTCAFAQGKEEELSGRVCDASGKGLLGVTCKLVDGKDSLLAYTITKTDGAYTIKVHAGAKSIVFSRMGYKTESINLENGRKTYYVALYEKDFELENVTVTVDPMIRRKDTLLYNVDAFRHKEDRSIEDVLKRMPGIEVDGNGQITYQGKSINKLNIEGQDLMGGGYNQATRNMPAEAVAQVQVMENNQPIKALEGKVSNDRATLNLKLKNGYKARPFGEVEGGTGIGSTIWDNRLTAININRKNQFLLTGAMNNRGIDLSALTKEMDSYGSIYNTEPLPSPFLYSPTAHTPPLSKLYYLDNKSCFTGLNYLHAFSAESNLRVNVAWYHDHSLHRDSTFNRYVATDTVTVFENNHIDDKTDILKARMRYELNSRKVYLNDEITSTLEKSDALDARGSNIGQADESVAVKTWNIQNTLNATVNTGTVILDISSMARMYGSRERLGIRGNSTDGCTADTARLRNFFTRNRVGTNISFCGNSLSLAYIMEYKSNDVRPGKDSGWQESHYWLHTIEPVYEIKVGRHDIELSLPVEQISYTDMHGEVLHKTMFSPMLDADFKFSPMLTADITAGINRSADTDIVPMDGLVQNNYRTFTIGTDSMSFSRTEMASLRLAWLNTANMLSWNIYAGWQHVKTDLQTCYLYTEELTVAYPLWKDNDHTSWSVAANVKKVFRQPALTISGSVGYSYNKALAIQNGVEDYLRYSAVNMNVRLGWNKLHYMSVSMVCAGNVTWKKHDAFSESINVLKNAYTSLRLDFNIAAKFKAYTDLSLSTFEIAQGQYSTNIFLNTGASYDLSKVFTVEVSAANLLNRSFYSEATFNGANYRYTGIPLRGREVMFGIRFKF